MKKAVFLDRDGTLIKDVGYLSSLDQIEIIDRALAICRLCQQKGYLLIVVTNQSGVARGLFSETFVGQTHTYLDILFRQHGVMITRWYSCPHHPDQAVVEQYKKHCLCRKPGIGMLEQAAREYTISLSDSIMIGDTEKDFCAGRAAHCKVFDITKLVELSDQELDLLF